MDTGDIKDRKGGGRGGYSTGTSKAVAKVENGLEVSHRHSCEVGPGPTLRESQCLRETKYRDRPRIPGSSGMVHGDETIEGSLDKKENP